MRNKLMENVRKRITDNKEALPKLTKKAVDLELHPQPWWNRDFYDYAIEQEERRKQEGRTKW